MALKVPGDGENLLLEWAIKATTTPENLTLKLYKNDYTPADNSTAGDFTEADFTDYVAKTLERSGWDAVAQDANNKASIEYGTTQTWTCGATGNTVYGYYVVGATSGTLVWAERFATSRTLADGDQLSLVPRMTLKSEN